MEVVSSRDGAADIPGLYQRIHQDSGRSAGLTPERLAVGLAQGRFGAFIGLWQGKPASLVVTSDHGATTYDMAAARGVAGNVPLSHLLIHRAVLDAKSRGQAVFSFGTLFEQGSISPKLKSIATFKSGFASSFRASKLVKVFQ